jgi:hypothetical protein
MTFVRFLRELLTGIFGIVGDVSTVVFVLTFFVPGLESFRVVLFVAIAIGFIGSAFNIYKRYEGVIKERGALHAAEVSRLQSEIDELKRPKFTAETRGVAESAYRKLDRTQKFALAHLLVAGDMTDRQALNYLHTKGMAMNYGSIFSSLTEVGLVQRVMQDRQRAEHVTGYTGNYTIAPRFREVLTELVASDPEARG